jgi:hypothetical protein
MVSPAVDLAVFVGVTATALLPWLASDVLHVRGYFILAAVALANGPHLISTWTRVYLPRRERFRRPIHYWVVPGLLAAFAVGCYADGGGRGPTLVRTAIFYWASWHFASQSWGILRIYQRRHDAADGARARLEKALIFLPALFCVVHRLYTGPWTLFGVEILHPRPRAWMVNGLGALLAALAALYVASWIARPRGVVWLRPLYMAMSAFGFYLPYLVIRDGTAAFAAAALWHAIQYIGIVWLYNRRRYAGGIDPDARLIAEVSQPGRSLAYVGVIALCAAAVYAVAWAVALAAGVAFQSFALTVWTALTLGHYYLDGVIWKFRQYDLRPLSATNT